MKYLITTLMITLFGSSLYCQTVVADEVNASQNSFACVNFSAESDDIIVAIQGGFLWDPTLLAFVGFTPSSTMKGDDLATNDDFVSEGEFRFVYLQAFTNGGLGQFNFQMCFQVLGSSGQSVDINILDTEELPFEVTVLDQNDADDGLRAVDYELESARINITESVDDCLNSGVVLECVSTHQTLVNPDGKLTLFAEDLLVENDPNSPYLLSIESSLDINGIGSLTMNCNTIQDSVFQVVVQNICTGEECSITVIADDFQNSCNSLVDVSSDEIAVYMRPAPFYIDSYGSLMINGTRATAYGSGVYGLPKSAIMNNGNELVFQSAATEQLTGLSTLDEVMLIKHLLGVELLEGWQIVAADIDQSGDLSFTRDFVGHRQLILGIIANLPGDNYFIAARNQPISPDLESYNFTNDYNSYTFNRNEINETEGIILDIYKYGDLNDNFSVHPRSKEHLYLEIEDLYIEAGNNYSIPIRLKDADLVEDYFGLQFSIKGNFKQIELADHLYGDKLLTHKPEQSQLNISLVSEVSLNEFEFELHLEAKESGWLSSYLQFDESFDVEYVGESLNLFDLNLEFYNPSDSDLFLNNKIQLYPNPVFSELTIKLASNMVGEELEIFNTLGQVQFRTQVKNETIKLNRNDLGAAGLKYVRVGQDIIQEIIVLN